MVLRKGILFTDSIKPISPFPTVLYHTIYSGTKKGLPIIHCLTFIKQDFILHCHILPCIQQIRHFINILPTYITIIGDFKFTHPTLFGSNQNYTIGGTRTIDSSRSSIFQDIYTLNISWIQSIDITTCHTINYIKGSRITDSTQTTDIYLKTFTRLTIVGSNIHTRCLALQGAQSTCCIQFSNIFAFHLYSSPRYQFLLLYTVTHYDYFIQQFRIFL